MDPGQKISIFSGNFTTKKSIFHGKVSTNFDFFRKFHKRFDFSRQISKEFRLFRQFHKKSIFQGKFSIFSGNFTKISIFQCKFPKNFDFLSNFTKISIFQATIGYLQLFLGKLFYFTSNVTTFEHTSCT